MDDLVILVWEEPELTSLYIIRAEALVRKYSSEPAQIVTVNGEQAAWLEQVHSLEFPPGFEQPLDLIVEGNVLIWEGSGNFTYRLEGNFSLEEALRIAESGTN